MVLYRERQFTERLLARWHLVNVNRMANGKHSGAYVMQTLGYCRAKTDRARHSDHSCHSSGQICRSHHGLTPRRHLDVVAGSTVHVNGEW